MGPGEAVEGWAMEVQWGRGSGGIIPWKGLLGLCKMGRRDSEGLCAQELGWGWRGVTQEGNGSLGRKL